MKLSRLGLALAGATIVAAPLNAQVSANTAVGRWQTETRGGIVEIARCGPSLCGRLVASEHLRTNPDLRDVNNSDKSLRNRQLKGLQILSGFTQDGNVWDGGKIYNAEDGKTYKARITPAGPNELKLRGCVFVPFCKTQTWKRVR
ncbi:DUF2147 domain-containing protein [Sphingomonas aracearum]|uniref:DUF2147 domain-containing protein n=1 Tax=Sphingomonas aracearum TaxID=2283317 RepID=UPI002685788C